MRDRKEWRLQRNLFILHSPTINIQKLCHKIQISPIAGILFYCLLPVFCSSRARKQNVVYSDIFHSKRKKINSLIAWHFVTVVFLFRMFFTFLLLSAFFEELYIIVYALLLSFVYIERANTYVRTYYCV